MSPLGTQHLHAIFDKLDRNGDGAMSLDELMWLLEKVGVCASQDELELLIGKQSLDPVDFVFFYQRLTVNRSHDVVGEAEEKDGIFEGDLRKAFEVFDLNDDGFISCDKLQTALSKMGLWDESCGRDCKSMIGVYDLNNDGLLDFQEFKDMMMLA